MAWFHCPYCGKKLYKIDNTARGVVYKCKLCKREVRLNVSIPDEELIWYCCPICEQKLCKIDTTAKGVYLKCKKCHNEVEVKFLKEVIKTA